MLFTNQFHEDTFDGVVIKIPKWMIDLNGNVIKDALKHLETILEDSTGNSMDKMLSMNELANYESKKDTIQKEKDKRENAKLSEEKREADLANQNIIPTIWKNKQGVIDGGLRVPLKDGTELYFNTDEIVTKKGNETVEFREKFNKLIPEIDLFKFSWINNMPYLTWLTSHDKHIVDIDKYFKFNGFTMAYGWNLAIKYKVLSAKVYFKKGNKIYYTEYPIGYESGNDRDPTIFKVISFNKLIDLDNYELKYTEFIKKPL